MTRRGADVTDGLVSGNTPAGGVTAYSVGSEFIPGTGLLVNCTEPSSTLAAVSSALIVGTSTRAASPKLVFDGDDSIRLDTGIGPILDSSGVSAGAICSVDRQERNPTGTAGSFGAVHSE